MLGKALTTAAAGSAAGAAAGAYIEDVFSTWLYTGNNSSQKITNGINLGDAVETFLTGKTITNIGSTIDGGSLSAVNDGVLPTTNTGFCYTAGALSIYVDMGSATVVTGYLIAPQGSGTTVYNTIEGFHVKASNDASSWTTIATFSGNGTSYPAWAAGTLRPFTFSNTTAYRYWRLDSTDASNDSITEWALLVDTAGNGEGGLVWIKARSSATYNNILQDTERGYTSSLKSNTTAAAETISSRVSGFSSDGFSVGSNANVNASAQTYASWTFRKAEKFFDVVTYTGNGTAGRTVSHNLGSVPGMIIVKKTSGTGNWAVYHNQLGASQALYLHTTGAAFSSPYWNSTSPTDSVFTLNNGGDVNGSGATYVAYLFAHDAGGFGDDGTESVIKCGSYTGTGSYQEINLGWEAQWVLIKKATNNNSALRNWHLFDNMRGATVDGVTYFLKPNTSDTASGFTAGAGPAAVGFNVNSGDNFNTSGETYIYIAIRRGPMKTPTDATEVFAPFSLSAGEGADTFISTGFPVDTYMTRRTQATGNNVIGDRLKGIAGGGDLMTTSIDAEGPNAGIFFMDHSDGVTVDFDGGQYAIAPASTSNAYVRYFLRRAPGFFDVVAYTGTGSATTVSHNLGVVPELLICKSRSTTGYWWVQCAEFATPGTDYLNLDGDGNVGSYGPLWNSTQATSSVFSLGNYADINGSGRTFIAYLFATVSGVSKVGSYTGTGTTKDIDCGFASGARFVMIKRTDASGDWYYWDTARGIVSGNDDYLRMNSTGAEVTSTDYIDPLSSGFQISSSAPAAINASGGSYIYFSVA